MASALGLPIDGQERFKRNSIDRHAGIIGFGKFYIAKVYIFEDSAGQIDIGEIDLAHIDIVERAHSQIDIVGEAEAQWTRILEDVATERSYSTGRHILDEQTSANVEVLPSGARIYRCPTPVAT